MYIGVYALGTYKVYIGFELGFMLGLYKASVRFLWVYRICCGLLCWVFCGFIGVSIRLSVGCICGFM